MKNHAAISIKNPTKSKCGDASFAENIIIGNNEYILLIVADGVSRAPKDWLASRSTVTFISEKIAQSSLQIAEALKSAIETANENIVSGVEDTLGMLSTLSAIVFSEKEKKLWWANVGDSRIFGLKNNAWQQLSTDDSTSIPYRENGKLKLRNGVPIMMNALTKAIGQSGLEIAVTEISVDEYEAFALASDGFYGLYSFEKYTSNLVRQADMNKAVKELQETIISEITDDASIAVLRLQTSDNINLKKILLEGDSEKISVVAVLNVLETELRNAVIEKDAEYTEKLLHLMQTRNISYEKPKMVEILELMIKHQSPAVQQMISIIRKL